MPLLCSKSSNGLASNQNKIQGLLWSLRPWVICTHTYPIHTLFFLCRLTLYPLPLSLFPLTALLGTACILGNQDKWFGTIFKAVIVCTADFTISDNTGYDYTELQQNKSYFLSPVPVPVPLCRCCHYQSAPCLQFLLRNYLFARIFTVLMFGYGSNGWERGSLCWHRNNPLGI